ncbi:MAG: hypothetical protein CMM33_04975 [Rhodospirillaceae bacterium]|nr:hypothetical protein [Rhodospirillaceae bacterium]
MFKRLKYALRGKRKNPLGQIWFAIRNNRAEMYSSLGEVHLSLESLTDRINTLESKPKRGRPKKIKYTG